MTRVRTNRPPLFRNRISNCTNLFRLEPNRTEPCAIITCSYKLNIKQSPPRCPTDAINITARQLQLRVTTPHHCLICTLPTEHLPCSSRRRRQSWWGIASWVASTTTASTAAVAVLLPRTPWMDCRRPMPGLLGGGSWLRFKHPPSPWATWRIACSSSGTKNV